MDATIHELVLPGADGTFFFVPTGDIRLKLEQPGYYDSSWQCGQTGLAFDMEWDIF